jgi:hypothetical protein
LSPRESARVQPLQSAHHVEYFCSIVALVVAAWFYLWTATSAGSPFSSKLQHDDLYNRLADGFLAGQLSFVEKPAAALANLNDPWDPAQNGGLSPFHDVSYYKGRYYLYFGAAPALLLLAPWKAATGSYLGENVAAAIFAWLGVAASIAMVLLLRRRYFPRLGGWIAGVCCAGLGFANFAPILLRRPVYYELAISSAYAFAMTALLCIALAMGNGTKRRLWLCFSGIAYGLTLASRPNYLFGAVILAVPLLPALRLWREKKDFDVRGLLRDAISVGAPLVVIGAILLAYNAMRFGNPLEFGTYYMLAGLHPQHDALTSFRFFPTNIWFYFLARAQLSAYFPFFQVIHIPWFTLPAGYIGEEDVYGLCNAPFYWFAFLLIYVLRGDRLPALGTMRDFCLGILALVACNFLVIGRLNGASNRYMVDLFTPLLPLACLGIFWVEQSAHSNLRRVGTRIAWIGALAFTAAFNLFVSLEHNDLFEYYNPIAFRQMAHALDHLSSWFGETSPSKTGPIQLRLRFPRDQTGHLQPLVVTGVSFKADFIYLYYTDENHIQVGFEHTSYGGAMTKEPIETDYAAEHVIEITMGSLFPPADHPYFDKKDNAEKTRLKHSLKVVLDGHELLSGRYDFYDSSPGDVSIGLNPVSEAFGRRFTGQILHDERMTTGKEQ